MRKVISNMCDGGYYRTEADRFAYKKPEPVKKIVITGAPCSGKTSLLEELAARGHNTIEETAREVLSEHKKLEGAELQREISYRQLMKERRINETYIGGTYFLDRSIIDNVAYSKHHLGRIPKDVSMFVEIANLNRYDAVFLLERFPIKQDAVRHETDEEAQKLHEHLIDAYKSFGYKPILVSNKIGIKERANFVLGNI